MAARSPLRLGRGCPASVTFINHTTKRVGYYWISNEGNAQRYGSMVPGQSRVMDSYLGHRWRLAVPDSDLRVVCEFKNRRAAAIIEESPFGLTLRWEVDDLICPLADKIDTPSTLAPNSSPDVFIRSCNVWTRSRDGTETQLSFDGVPDNAYRDVFVSPSNKHVIALQCKPASRSFAYWIDSAPKDQFQPKLITHDYLKAGDDVEFKQPRLFSLGTKSEVQVDNTLFHSPYSISHISWSEDGEEYYFVYNERGHQHIRLLSIAISGRVRTIAEESSKTFVDYNHKLYYKIMPSTNELLWASERDGWNHLYLFNLNDGAVKNQITKGPWVVRGIEKVDLERRQIWFEGLGMLPGKSPYYSHLATVGFDGSDLRVITAQGDGTHVWKWGPDRRFLIDTWSRVDCLPQTAIREANLGNEVILLHEDTFPAALENERGPEPERFTALGRDDKTDIYGIILRPRNFDASQSYPVIEYIYAGPQTFAVPRAFQNVHQFRAIANQGYIVVVADGMGTNWRSKAFHDVCHKDLKDGGSSDRIAWIRAAAKSRPWMDLSRVGCYGSSSGGQNAAAAVIHHSEFYKAAVAMSGCHDNRMGQLLWDEMWMGYPVDETYHDSSNVTHAHKLGGALMLVATQTLRLAGALIKADKDFDLVYVPGGSHYVDDVPFVQRKRDAFFRKYLQHS